MILTTITHHVDKRREAIDQLHAAERQRQRKDSHTMLRKDDPDYIRSLAKGVNKKVLLDIPKEQWPLLATPGMKPIPANVRDIFLSRPEEGECSSEASHGVEIIPSPFPALIITIGTR